ncbi:MAG TPA: hypothetical protein VFW19_10355 [Allosphingosinicella sp.]|nr:hypothetical protein [Allosphingosinicella sp.]
MSVEGLWAVEFGHAGAAFAPVNAGIVVLETGRVFGGDTWFAYTGDYEVNGSGITGSLKVRRHHHDGMSIDAWETGEDTFNVDFSVTWMSDQSAAEGVMTRNGQALGLRLKKLAELP